MGFVANYVGNLAAIAARRQPRRPLLFSVYLTHRCPLACRYCCDGEGVPFKQQPADELPTSEMKRLFAVLRQDSDTLDVTGGDPLERADLEDLLWHARALGFRVVLNTKGIGLVERPRLLGLADALVLSVDALDPARLAGLIGRPETAAKEILRTLDWALAQKDSRKRLVLSAVATPDNLPDVEEVLRLAERERLCFQVSPEIVGRSVHPKLVGNPAYASLVGQVIAAKARGARVLGVPDYLRGIRDLAAFKCHPMLMPTVRPDGQLYYPCLDLVRGTVDVLRAGRFRRALEQVGAAAEPPDNCEDRCHIFCHMALSLLQRRPLAALGELRLWS